jgi:nucleotide-binding universal stress UspA family protein
MFKNILIAYDGSTNARKAAEITGRLARSLATSAEVWIVTVMDSAPREVGEPYLSQAIEENTKVGHDLLQEAGTLIGEVAKMHMELLFGTPSECILQVADTRGCDLIIMGAVGMSLIERLLLGSQTHKVVSNAKCPVMVIK